jgi:hypothetical protein
MRKISVVVLVVVLLLTVAAGSPRRRFRAKLTGDAETPPVVTDAAGNSIYQFDPNETRMRFRLKVGNIEDVVAAHIHCGAVGVAGPPGITLFSGGPISIEKDILAEGVVTAPDADNACGWENLGDAANAVRSGDTYVNVHTLAHPSGEIRGQIH